jgi:hypothetical protein
MPDHLGRSAADALGETVNVPIIEALRHDGGNSAYHQA